MLTGEQADLSDAVEKTLATRGYYYSVWNASYTLPGGCVSSRSAEEVLLCQNGELTTEQCTGPVLCHTDTIMPAVSLGLYTRSSATVYLAEYNGVFKYFCEQADGDTCVSGHHPKLTGYPPGAGNIRRRIYTRERTRRQPYGGAQRAGTGRK